MVFGEAYLTMQSAGQKARIASELARIVRPGGRLGLHEVAFTADTVPDRQEAIRSELTSAIKVPVSPLPLSGWVELLEGAGFEVVERHAAPLHLLEPRRLVADEGVRGAARFVLNVLRHPAERRRVLAMRRAMHANASHLEACALVARRRAA